MKWAMKRIARRREERAIVACASGKVVWASVK